MYFKGNTPYFSRNWSGVWKNWARAYKTGNISETVENRANVTIKGVYKVVQAFACSNMYDLG